MRWVCALILLALLTAGAGARNAQWRDDGAIWMASLAFSPNKARGYNELGLHMLSARDYEGAHQALQRSLALAPYQPTVYINLGIVLQELGRYGEAAAVLEQAIRYLPNDPSPFYNLGILYYDRLHDGNRAFPLLLKARDLDPLEPDVHLHLSRIYQDRGDLVRSREELERYRYLKH